MAIGAGTRLGPYELVGRIGTGGMGEVWRGRDTRLDRTVAIKLLPPELANSAQFRLRLEREAKTISQLNDPHICTLYDIGRHDGQEYLVMEFVDGDTLADRLSRGPLPFAQVIRYGIEIAAALERAHAAGIVHRDLKPANVMLTKSGAKLLDFGLAKVQPTVLTAESSALATEQKPLTAEGTILGTFQYMAPEQLEGNEADARTDLFALGTILYEMATGRRAFQGKTKTSLIAAIVDRDPPSISSIQPLTPALFERVVKTCLAKDPSERWQSAHDVRVVLEWLAGEMTAATPPRRQTRIAWGIAGALAIIAIAAIAMLLRATSRAPDQEPVLTSIVSPPRTSFDFFVESGPPEVSPDGKKIAFVAAGEDGSRSLWVRTLDSPVARQLNGTVGASHPFWSPDSQQIAFTADGVLKRIEFTGGAPVTIVQTGVIRGGSWSRDGTIIVGSPGGDPIRRVSAHGGTPVEVTTLDLSRQDISHRWPHFLPDGKHFLFLSGPHANDESADFICVGSVDKKMRKDLIRASSNAVFLDGWILYLRDRVLTAQRFDTRNSELIGNPVAAGDEPIEFDGITVRGFFSVAPTGTLLYQTGEGIRETQLTWVDRSGKLIRTVGEPRRYAGLALSPDGRFIAHGVLPRQNIWTFDQTTGAHRRLTFATNTDFQPAWSPDGTKLVYSARQAARAADLYLKDLRTGSEQPLVVNDKDKTASSWSADGKLIFYTEQSRGSTRRDIAYFSFADGKSHPYLNGPADEMNARISPDGKWVAYTAVEPPPQLYIAPFPPTGAKWQVSSGAGGGVQARWRADGKELFFSGSRMVYAVPIKLSATPEIGPPITLFKLPSAVTQSWDVTPDGQKFLINARVEPADPPAPLTVVQHFDTVLRRIGRK